MGNRTGSRISTLVIIMMIGTIFFAWNPEPSSAQNEGFKSYQLMVFCGDSSLAAATFWHDVPDDGNVGRPLMGLKTVCAGKKCSGVPVTLANALAQVPAAARTKLQEQVDKHRFAREDWFITCLGDKPPEKKCEKSCGTPKTAACKTTWQGLLKAVAEVEGTRDCQEGYDPLRDIVDVDFSFSVGKDGQIDGSGTATITLEGECRPLEGQAHGGVARREQIPKSFPIKVTGFRSGNNRATIFLTAPGVTAKRTLYVEGGPLSKPVRTERTDAFSPWGLTEPGVRQAFTIELKDCWNGKGTPVRLVRPLGTLVVSTEVSISQ